MSVHLLQDLDLHRIRTGHKERLQKNKTPFEDGKIIPRFGRFVNPKTARRPLVRR